ncbi:MAG: sulfatase-like hydrolase/transferase [Acidobacteria bacterium]|nr:sulfatase-like hydrolase/transferase [Acidobacteriota bacterium]
MYSFPESARRRRRRRPWVAAAAVLYLICWVACSPRDAERPELALDFDATNRPSVLLITLDTTRADHLEPYGVEDVETPALSRLAAEGVVFEHAMATSPVTAPAHASLLTGLYPPHHGVRNNSTHYLPEEIPTLAEWLSEAGYRTAAFVSTVILEARYGLDQGFGVYDDEIRSAVAGDERRMTVERPAGATTDRALAWLDTLGSNESFFLWVHYYDPHIPYSPPSPWAERYPNRGYDGEIAYTDSQIARLLQHPRAMTDDVIVMAIGDHGESLGEHGEKTHGLLVYESTIRVPWILRIPGLPGGLHIESPISQVDMVPTIVELAALDTKSKLEALDGQSLVPLFRGHDLSRRRLLFAETEVPFFAYGWSPLRSVREGAVKFIDAPVPELYDLERDPAELSNLAAERSRDVQRLAAEAEAWTERRDDTGSTVSVDLETAEMLRALGYSAGDPGRPEGEGRGNPVELMPVHDELQRVRELLVSGQPREAVSRAQGALTIDPENLAALQDLSRGFALLGRLDEAAEVAAKASAVAPWSAQAAMVEADVEFQRGRYLRALEIIDRALELDERFVEARLDRTRYLAALGRTAEASAELERLLAEYPDNSWVEFRYAEIVEVAEGNLEAAEKRLREILNRNPKFTEAWLLLGTTYARTGRTSAAIAVYREAIDNGATRSEIMTRLALLLAERSDPEAESALHAAIDSNPVVRADLHVALGELLATQGRNQEARQQFQLAADAPPLSVGTRNSTAVALLQLGRPHEAEAIWRELIRDHPEFGRAWLNLATLAIQLQSWAEAERFARSAIDKEPRSAGAWNSLAIALEELGRGNEAESAYRRSAEIDSRDWRALFNLGIYYRKNARYEEAASVQREVLARNPKHAGAHFELGILYAGPLGDPEQAKVHLRATIAADPNHPRARQARIVLDQLQ